MKLKYDELFEKTICFLEEFKSGDDWDNSAKPDKAEGEEAVADDGELDPEQERQNAINKRFEVFGETASEMLKKILKDKTEIFMNKIRGVGIDEVLYDFISNKFLPSLKSPDDKLFLTVNLDEFVGFFIGKFSATLL